MENRPGKRTVATATHKKISKALLGGFEIFSPRDRNATFEPQTVPKRQRVISEDIDKQILAYMGGDFLTAIFNRILKKCMGWNFPMGPFRPLPTGLFQPSRSGRTGLWTAFIRFCGSMRCTLKYARMERVKSKAIYSILAVSTEGQKEVIGIYFGDNESSSFWRSVLHDLKMRGLQDICIACIDNLKGFGDAIEELFPQTDVQLCLVHQMRNSMKYLA